MIIVETSGHDPDRRLVADELPIYWIVGLCEFCGECSPEVSTRVQQLRDEPQAKIGPNIDENVQSN